MYRNESCNLNEQLKCSQMSAKNLETEVAAEAAEIGCLAPRWQEANQKRAEIRREHTELASSLFTKVLKCYPKVIKVGG